MERRYPNKALRQGQRIPSSEKQFIKKSKTFSPADREMKTECKRSNFNKSMTARTPSRFVGILFSTFPCRVSPYFPQRPRLYHMQGNGESHHRSCAGAAGCRHRGCSHCVFVFQCSLRYFSPFCSISVLNALHIADFEE